MFLVDYAIYTYLHLFMCTKSLVLGVMNKYLNLVCLLLLFLAFSEQTSFPLWSASAHMTKVWPTKLAHTALWLFHPHQGSHMVAVQTQVDPEKTQQGEDQKHPLLQSNALQPPIEILPPHNITTISYLARGGTGCLRQKWSRFFNLTSSYPSCWPSQMLIRSRSTCSVKVPYRLFFRSPF